VGRARESQGEDREHDASGSASLAPASAIGGNGAFAALAARSAPLARALGARAPLSNRAVGRMLARQSTGYGYEFSDDPLNAGGFGPGDATIRVKPGPVRATLIRPRYLGDSVRPDLERLLNEFAAAGGWEAKNAVAMRAVEAVIAAYGLSRKGVYHMRYEPNLTEHDAETLSEGNQARQSRILFGPGSFNGGWEWLVHIVAHELEHVRQELLGGYGTKEDPVAGGEQPVSEFLAYAGSVLQAGNTAGPSDSGFLSALKAGPDAGPPGLPPLPPVRLADQAARALKAWRKIRSAGRSKYWQEFQGVRDKLAERLRNEAPRHLGSPPSSSDPFSPEYQEWAAATKSPWVAVREQWQQYEAWKTP
jgi:hypothetical protein